MGRIVIVDPDRVRKRGSAKDRVTNGGSGSPIQKKKIVAHHCIYDTIILLYLFIRILTTFSILLLH